MRLKRVKIFGFKTFAERTEFDVDGDLIAVVGPNGCGKSNIVDAILWGLGEGNARHLRAQTGTDVIFNGSSRRKPVGFAEVSLHFDNEDGALPIPTPEVVITRRLNRAAESEYSINRQTCRLRDILDLLADSGLGRAGYSIVGQKEIDQALSASAEERRAWLDEAAGVQRYRVRKHDSLKRLAAAKDHLSRVTDIIREIEAQREPLREEAEVAKRYKGILTSLREVESGLLILEVARGARDVEQLEERIESCTALLASENLRADRLDLECRDLGTRLSQLEGDIDAIRHSQQGLLSNSERAQAAIDLGEEKLRSLATLELSLAEEADQAQNRLSEFLQEQADCEAQLEKEEDNLKWLASEGSDTFAAAESMGNALVQLDRQLNEAREIHAQRLRLDAAAAQRAQSLKQLERELEGLLKSLPDVVNAEIEAEKAFEEAQANYRGSTTEIEALVESLRESEREEDSDAKKLRELLQQRAQIEGRRRGIEATIDAHEGLTFGAKTVLEAASRGDLQDTYVPVGEAIEVEKDYAIAIETALAGSANDLIVQSDAAAKRAIQFLKERKGGRATFQPIPLMRPVHRNSDLDRLLTQPGIIGTASELVECDKEYRPVIDSLLGRVVVVEDVDTALRYAKSSGWSRLVTLEGELVHSSGAVTGGHHKNQSYGMVQRKADLQELEKLCAGIDVSVQEIEKAKSMRLSQSESIRSKIDDLRTRSKSLTDEHEEARNWLANVSNERKSMERSHQKLLTECESLKNQVDQSLPEVNVTEIETARDSLIKELAAKSADVEQFEARMRDAEFRRNQAADRLAHAIRRQQIATESETKRENRMSSLGPERDRIAAEIIAAQNQLEQSQRDSEQIGMKLKEALEHKQSLLEQSFRLSEEAKGARANAVSTADVLHQAELNRARSDSKRATALERLIEEYGIEEEQAIAMEPTIEVPEDAAVLTSRLRRDLKSMGDVNVGAVEAYDRLQERFFELENQRVDVESGIEEVLQAIKELDGLTSERFKNTFEQVQESFSKLFTRLFGGGSGHLSLTQPDNLLESGIEIEVMLPGKNRQRLELLSGGERSLCATAFLFSLLLARPSPLVVLDEVDAPLDGGNVERFISLLRDFSSGEVYLSEGDDSGALAKTDAPATKTQFIVITHNPTTIESAPVWLGVTMQEPGVSSLVPLRTTPTNPAVSLA